MAPAPRLSSAAAALAVSALSAAVITATAPPARAATPLDAAGTTTRSYSFRLQTYTDFAAAAKASPSVVAKNATLTVRGTLLLSNWNNDGYQRFARQPVQLQFAASGSRNWSVVARSTTDGSGAAVARVKVSGQTARTGSYRFYYAGNNSTAPATSAPVRISYRQSVGRATSTTFESAGHRQEVG